MNSELVIKKISLKNNLSIGKEIDKIIFNVPFNKSLIHQVVMIYIYNKYIRTKAQKSRGQVRGGGAKPWRQKGTGRARAGTKNSPLWRGGGKVFANQGNKSLHAFKKINKKMYKKALCIIFSELLRQNRLFLLCDDVFSFVKTKNFVDYINKNNLKKVLIIINKFDKNIIINSRNLYNIKIIFIKQINPIDLIKYKNILISEEAIKVLEERLK